MLPRLTRRRALILLPLLAVGVLLALFAVNGLVLAWNETPYLRTTSHPAARQFEPSETVRIKIVAYNIAKGFIHEGGLSFADEEVVRERILRIAQTVRAEQPDFVFLSEAVVECGPSPVNQVELIAEASGMAFWAFGENFNFGLPYYRIASGNAILSRWPITPLANPSLAGRRPFFITKNNRRMLWCRGNVAGHELLLASVHTDSFNLENNLAQTHEMLDFAGEHPAILAGDFNACPGEPPIELIRSTQRFAGSFADTGTFPAHAPDQTLDFIFAPAAWELVEHRVLALEDSDHRPVVATFNVKVNPAGVNSD